MKALIPAAVLAAVVAVTSPEGLQAQDYHGDVRPLIEAKCLGCHNNSGVAFSMEDAEGTYARRRPIGTAILTQKMPPWLAEAGHQEYVDDLSFSREELATVRAWVDAGYPEGEASAETARSTEVATFVPDASAELLPGEAYLPDQDNKDDYRCFLVDWPVAEPGYLTGFRTRPGNLGVAHHTVVYAVNPEMADRFRELDAEEEGAGYQCFGGAQPDRLGSRAFRQEYEQRYPNGVEELYRSDFWLAHWAPGMDGYTFPEGTGVRVEPGTLLVVQMHYYSAHAPGEVDIGTVLDFQIADQVERPGFHYPLSENDWLGGERNGSMVVPPGQQATYETSVALGDLVGYVSRVTQVPRDSIQALEIHSANLHMHAIGHSGEITLTDPNGRVETLLAVPAWDLNWQRDFTFTQPKVFDREALEDVRLRVQCTFENPTDQMVYGGFGSDDEMCFNFSYITVQRGTVATETDQPRRRE